MGAELKNIPLSILLAKRGFKGGKLKAIKKEEIL